MSYSRSFGSSSYGSSLVMPVSHRATIGTNSRRTSYNTGASNGYGSYSPSTLGTSSVGRVKATVSRFNTPPDTYNPRKYATRVTEVESNRPLPLRAKRDSSLLREHSARLTPVKATKDYGTTYNSTYMYSSKYGSSNHYKPTETNYRNTSHTNGLSRRRTSSIQDLTSNTSSLSLSDSKKFGSQSSLERSSRARDHTDLYDKPKKGEVYPTKNYIHTNSSAYEYQDTEHDTFPAIKTRNDSMSRSPSLDNDSISSKRGASVSINHHNNYGHSVDTSKGLVGLKNLGNTCFMNSVLQCLSNTNLLLEFCLSRRYEGDLNKTSSSMKGALVQAYANLMSSLWSGSSYISPTDFKKQIQKFAPRFMGYSQQDAQEFLVYLLEGLHEDVNRIKEKKKRTIIDDGREDHLSASQKSQNTWKRYLEYDDSKLVDIFVGQLRSTLKCAHCDYESNTFDPFWDLSLPIAKSSRGVSLASCFDLFTQTEVLDGDEKPTCARCKAPRKCTKKFSIQRFPKVLVIHLKRFDQSSYYRSKLSTLVDFPLNDLDLSNYAAPSCSMRAPIHYNLYAVSNHSGTPYGGHYTAYSKNPYSGRWHYFNDQRVTPISSSGVKTEEAYVLFYELSTSPAKL